MKDCRHILECAVSEKKGYRSNSAGKKRGKNVDNVGTAPGRFWKAENKLEAISHKSEEHFTFSSVQ